MQPRGLFGVSMSGSKKVNSNNRKDNERSIKMVETIEKQLYGNMSKKETEELLNIWTKYDKEEYTEEAFETIKQVLIDRGVDVPLQKSHKVPETEDVQDGDIESSDNNKKANEINSTDDIKVDIRGWGFGLIFFGLVHIVASGFLNPVWGGVIILVGIINLCVQHRIMYIANGVAILMAGVMNLALTGSGGWTVFGMFQLFWGVSEIKKFFQYGHLYAVQR